MILRLIIVFVVVVCGTPKKNEKIEVRLLQSNFVDFDNSHKLIRLFRLLRPRFLLKAEKNILFLHGAEFVLQRNSSIPLDLQIAYMKVTNQVCAFASKIVKQDLFVQSMALSIMSSTLAEFEDSTFSSVNLTRWSFPPHSDNCDFDDLLADDCKYRKNSAGRDYTAIVYLNEIPDKSGDFAFIDAEDATDAPFQPLSRNGYVTSLDPNSYSLVHFNKNQRRVTVTTIPPRPGQLVFFSSGGENRHGVLKQTDSWEDRFAMIVWLSLPPVLRDDSKNDDIHFA